MKLLVMGDFQGLFPAKLKKRISKEEFDLVVCVGDYAGIADWYPWLKDSFKRSKKGEKWLSPIEYFGKKGFKKLLKKDDLAAKNVLRNLNSLGKPVIFVFGNGDDDWYQYPFIKSRKAVRWKINFVKRLKNMKNITYSSTRYKGNSFVGFGGYIDVMANHKKNPKTESDIARKKSALKRLKLARALFSKIIRRSQGDRIFVLHYPPRGVFDMIKDKRNPYNGKSTGAEFLRYSILKHNPRLVLCGHMHEYQGSKKLGNSLVVNPGDAEKGKYAVISLPENKNSKIEIRFVK